MKQKLVIRLLLYAVILVTAYVWLYKHIEESAKQVDYPDSRIDQEITVLPGVNRETRSVAGFETPVDQKEDKTEEGVHKEETFLDDIMIPNEDDDYVPLVKMGDSNFNIDFFSCDLRL